MLKLRFNACKKTYQNGNWNLFAILSIFIYLFLSSMVFHVSPLLLYFYIYEIMTIMIFMIDHEFTRLGEVDSSMKEAQQLLIKQNSQVSRTIKTSTHYRLYCGNNSYLMLLCNPFSALTAGRIFVYSPFSSCELYRNE